MRMQYARPRMRRCDGVCVVTSVVVDSSMEGAPQDGPQGANERAAKTNRWITFFVCG